ncbi:uncharacterized protein K452DRAFT_157493 [Aplosporella prunicola CBS 121167]|uniref:Uncharacterized protein n=1 Tax=Aplosporella prunicola CBS 121167 TaxID=1176127 RepID=A0A6A6AV52_9PEZI|nr:uncharacterized protein K452DRAFT_157493 [Aplosporella prunicola CBS 121167]KAF2135912.1 hypothetical protein K452DRAFT_157493 [Aplosporella prunicola CBS 121167]
MGHSPHAPPFPQEAGQSFVSATNAITDTAHLCHALYQEGLLNVPHQGTRSTLAPPSTIKTARISEQHSCPAAIPQLLLAGSSPPSVERSGSQSSTVSSGSTNPGWSEGISSSRTGATSSSFANLWRRFFSSGETERGRFTLRE